jgi:hypothetical protein
VVGDVRREEDQEEDAVTAVLIGLGIALLIFAFAYVINRLSFLTAEQTERRIREWWK